MTPESEDLIITILVFVGIVMCVMAEIVGQFQ